MSGTAEAVLHARLRRAPEAVLIEEVVDGLQNICFISGDGRVAYPAVAVSFHDEPVAAVYMNARTYARVAEAPGYSIDFNALRLVHARKTRRAASGVLKHSVFTGNFRNDESLADYAVVVPRTWGPYDGFIWELLQIGTGSRCGINLSLQSIVISPHAIFAKGGVLNDSGKAKLENMLEKRYSLTGRAINVGDVLYSDETGACVILALYGLFRTNSALYYWGGRPTSEVHCNVADTVSEWDAVIARKVSDIMMEPRLQPFLPTLLTLSLHSLNRWMDAADPVAHYKELMIQIISTNLLKFPAGAEFLRRAVEPAAAASASAKKGGRSRSKAKLRLRSK